MGRPTKYTPETAEYICERLANGESLRAICSGDDMPAASTVCKWAVDNVNGFFEQYTRAKQMRCLTMADELLEIADDGRNDTYADENGDEKIDYDVLKRSALRVDARKWLLVKYLPKVFGEKQEIDIPGGVNVNLPAVTVNLVKPKG